MKLNSIVPSSIARYIFTAVFAVFGFYHFMYGDSLVELVPDYLPDGIIWVYAAGLVLFFAAGTVIINKMAKIEVNHLGLMLLMFALLVWLPSSFEVPEHMPNVIKELALTMGVFIIANDSN